ncbi:helix-turn-helix transcriptional regulator [Butyricicoccus faecihominis]|uniref:helix-turn-helix domain-containing protein n=1 Tax=Butyricicoccaceae TaxID=3085642 RepID=UPI00247A4A66|nr:MULTISPECIES: helix-turn-helix transcriptional regulator [Butyricicoccaceae]MCQ5131070.1 helix-turn-helix transcriptional regulator [Butyricicoccus faecihominis]WNX83703.1 helix-turn-helix transcriptional regulator [Agathobaculum sp. NTUH-O15-33]
MFTYKPLWKLLIDHDMNKSELKRTLGLSSSTMTRLVHNEYVSLETLDAICTEFGCTPNDVIEHIPPE